MTVYLAFNEGEMCDSVADITSSTTTAVSGISRVGFRFSRGTTSNEISTTATFTGLTEGWVHCLCNTGYDNNLTRSGRFFAVLDSGGNTIIELWQNGNGNIQVSDCVVGNVPTGNTDTLVTETGNFDVDIHIKMAGTGGFVRLYIDGSLLFTGTGDTIQASGETTFTQLEFYQPRSVGFNIGNEDDVNNYGQVLVSDSNTIGADVYTLTPTAGSINDWPVGTVADVDEEDIDDSDQAYTDTDNDQFTVDTSVTLSSVTSPIKYTALVQSFRASADSAATVQNLTPFLNDTTATSTSFASSIAMSTGLSGYQEIWSTDPADASDWTATKINNYEFGLQADA